MSKINWQHSKNQMSIENEEIHIWAFNLNQRRSSIKQFLETLSCDEKQRAENYHFEKDCEYFILARGILRSILGKYLKIAPNKIEFSYNQFGKPLLSGYQLRFNIAHSQEIALFAIGLEREIGIDIEFVNNNFEILKTAEFFFSATEMLVLKNLPTDLQTEAFYNGWTRKEALLKAIGKGFSYPANELNVSLKSDDSEFITSDNYFSNFSLMTLPFEQNYKAALAVEGKIKEVCYWQE